MLTKVAFCPLSQRGIHIPKTLNKRPFWYKVMKSLKNIKLRFKQTIISLIRNTET